jgi:hypothetical protein
MTEYVYLGSLPYENEAEQLRIEPSETGTPFSYDFSPEREKALTVRGLIVRVPTSARPRRKGEE